MIKRLLWVFAFLLAVLGYCWYIGLFTSYNVITAKRDIRKGNVRFIKFGFPIPIPSPQQGKIDSLQNKYGVKEKNIGCIVTKDEMRGIEWYNKEVEQYLEARNGKEWMKRFQMELDTIINKE